MAAGLAVEVFKAVRVPVRAAFVRSVLETAAGVAGVSGSVAVRLTGDRELRRLNRSFLGFDETTDVLSFPSGSAAPGGFLGDLAVSWPAVGRQASLYGHPVEAELALLLVHGLLHLAGHDHSTPSSEAAMWRLTRRCLGSAGVRLAGGRLAVRPARAVRSAGAAGGLKGLPAGQK